MPGIWARIAKWIGIFAQCSTALRAVIPDGEDPEIAEEMEMVSRGTECRDSMDGIQCASVEAPRHGVPCHTAESRHGVPCYTRMETGTGVLFVSDSMICVVSTPSPIAR